MGHDGEYWGKDKRREIWWLSGEETVSGGSDGLEIRKCSSGKRRFLDKASCEARIKLYGNVGKVFAYHCPECDQWHMTSQEQNVKTK